MRSTRRAIPFADLQILRQRVLIAAKTAGLARRVEDIHFQQFLQRHAVCFGKPGCILALLEIGEELTRLDVSQRMMVRFPFITPDRKEVVEHETGTAESAVDQTRLRLIRIDTELVSQCVCFHMLTSFAMFSGSRYTV